MIPSLNSLSVTSLNGVGARIAERLARLNIRTVADILFHLPLRYEDHTHLTPIAALQTGSEALVEGTIIRSEIKQGQKRMLIAQLEESGHVLTLRFFYFNAHQQQMLKKGSRIRCYGEIRSNNMGLEIIHPEIKKLTSKEPEPVEQSLTPVYPTTEGLQQASWKKLTQQAIELLEESSLTDLLPQAIYQQFNFIPFIEALLYVHRPPSHAQQSILLKGNHPAQQRLAFEELLAHHLGLRRLRQNMQEKIAPKLSSTEQLFDTLLKNLQFKLTRAQQRVISEIKADLQKTTPMQRLIQGDVGCGKTVVAVSAILSSVEAGYQATIMAPTELLAEQHLNNMQQWLEPLNIKIGWLTGKHKGKKREALLEQLASAEIEVIVGTHALFQESVVFKKLGLIVIDEQHRFGVHQRLALREKGLQSGRYPHQLIMTATPIPRTLAMTAYAELDISVIDELPPGRQPVETAVIHENRRDAVIARVHQACQSGRQAYWVCTLIEESEALQCQAAEESAAQIKKALTDIRIGLIHGRMKADEKADVMAQFKAGDIDLLVATTVIEVGVDVPNASLMIIENAERLGLSQLHQLRGRVGRGNTSSACILMYRPPLSKIGRSRLNAMRETNDGFEISRRDLEIRGPGEILGTRQSGIAKMRIADVIRDAHLIEKVAKAAPLIMQHYPEHVEPLMKRWLSDSANYGEV